MLLYALTIFVSAFLLFQVEPIIAKIILPWFGGSAAVWTTCLLFFQIVLLAGYLYAHALFRYCGRKVQLFVHAGLLVASLVFLPVLPAVSWKPAGGEDPALRILLLLVSTVGLPFFLLSTTGPLVQAWFARRFPDAAPYRLYALSNAGSMLALLSYPFLVEPVFTTHHQAWGWSLGYVAFVALCGLTAMASRSAPEAAQVEAKDAPRPGPGLYVFWIALPACASVLLLSITNHLSKDVAAIPLLWVLPLSLYLLTFILCFERDGWYRRYPMLQLFAVALGGMAYCLSEDLQTASVKMLIPVFSVGLFLCCMVCHGELAQLKPHPRYLTSFYVMVSLGGALGGVLVGLVAPHLFRGYYEMQGGLAASGLLVLAALRRDPDSGIRNPWSNAYSAVCTLLAVGLVIYLGIQLRQSERGYRIIARNFYAGLHVSDRETGTPEAVRQLVNGNINHGEQFLNPERRRQPSTYYGPQSGVGLAIRERQPQGAMRVGVIGLGTGTIAAYGRPGDYYRFYEINPLVLRLARTEFSFLKDSMARVDVTMGDARLSLERESPQKFDVLAVDAFSGDSIPVHLLTREAMALYVRHLAPGGVVAVHVSNKYLALEPVVRLAADALGLKCMAVDTDDDNNLGTFGSTWVLVTARPDYFESTELQYAFTEVKPIKGLRVWTDDRSNLFQIVK